MFVIKCKNSKYWQTALFILSYYHVVATMYSDGEDPDSAYMVVEQAANTDIDDLSLAEMAFCGDWQTDDENHRWICPHCRRDELKNHPDGICGHLTFIEPKFRKEE